MVEARPALGQARRARFRCFRLLGLSENFSDFQDGRGANPFDALENWRGWVREIALHQTQHHSKSCTFTVTDPRQDALALVSDDCAVSTGYSSTLPVNGVARCLKVTGFPIPKNHKATIQTHLEFRLKGTDGWDANSLYGFYSPFEFKSTTTVTYAVGPTIRSANQTVGVVGVGKKVTAVGGFVFTSSGNPPPAGYKVRLYDSMTSATCGSSPAPVAENVVHADGFYFIWRTGSDQSSLSSAALLPSGVQYAVLLCKRHERSRGGADAPEQAQQPGLRRSGLHAPVGSRNRHPEPICQGRPEADPGGRPSGEAGQD